MYKKQLTEIKLYVMILIVFAVALMMSCNTYKHCPATKGMSGYSILRWHTDSRGLTSVVWKDNTTGKEWGLDYATREQLREEGLIK